MVRSLSQLTDKAAVQAALDEYTRVGQSAFLLQHGFGKASGYVVQDPRTGQWADSKAIAGVAFGRQFPALGKLEAREFSGGIQTVVKRLSELGFQVESIESITGMPWRLEEVSLIVADYLAMLALELAGQAYNKSEHRRRLLALLPGRSAGSIEFKHANISAAMLELGFPYIQGYQPRANFQRDELLHELSVQVARHAELDAIALHAAERPAAATVRQDYQGVVAVAPARAHEVREPAPAYARPAVRRDYLAREAQNRSLGLAGERFALDFERWRLVQLGAGQLAEQVTHVAVTEGDGLGYDIRSFEPDGRERFIEVKTTSFGDRTPFFVSANEVRFARDHADRFRLYRLFDFRAQPRLFELAGAIEAHCLLDASTYRASFG